MSGKRVYRWRLAGGLIAAAGLSVFAAAGASVAIAAPARTAAPAPSWKIVKSVKTGMAGDFSTVVAASST
jgi:hypothetical protein